MPQCRCRTAASPVSGAALDELDILRPSLVTEDWTARFAEHHALLHGFLRKNASAAEINEARKRITTAIAVRYELMISGRFNR